jgi:DNA invertase Pin-like site-specific DNA recombinase
MTENQGQTVAYIRVSSEDQNLGRQEDLADRADRVFREKESGKEGHDRPVLREAIDWVRSGDTLTVWSIDRLARSIVDLNSIAAELRAKGVALHFEKEHMSFDPGKEADPYSEVLFNVLGSFAQFERRIIRQRQLEGIAVAKAAGKYKGQKPRLFAADLVAVREMEAAGVPKAKIARDLNVSRKTVYRALDPAYMSIEQWHEATSQSGRSRQRMEPKLKKLEATNA